MEETNESKLSKLPKVTNWNPKFQTFTCKRCQKEMQFPYDSLNEDGLNEDSKDFKQPICAACTAKMNKNFEGDDSIKTYDSRDEFHVKKTWGFQNYE